MDNLPKKFNSCQALRQAIDNISHIDDFYKQEIANGFFSKVFKVEHKTTGQVMVLKKNSLLSNRSNMIKELQLMNSLKHPNILKYMGACVYEGSLHALTEYIPHGNLETLIQSEVELPWRLRQSLAVDIASGMMYLHSQRLIHRDLTSKNILVKQDAEIYTAVVGDFGLASKIPSKIVRLGSVGSPYWMSPECLKGEWYNESTDVFSYGICLCELIARVSADPDFLPRTEDFGLDKISFINIVIRMSELPPPSLCQIAFECCQVNQILRPTFSEIHSNLSSIVFPSSPDSPHQHLLLLATITSPRKNKPKKAHRSSSEETLLILPPSEKAARHFINPFKNLKNVKILDYNSYSSCYDFHVDDGILRRNSFCESGIFSVGSSSGDAIKEFDVHNGGQGVSSPEGEEDFGFFQQVDESESTKKSRIRVLVEKCEYPRERINSRKHHVNIQKLATISPGLVKTKIGLFDKANS